MFIVEPKVELVQATPNAGQLLERIARVCYNSEARMACDCEDGDCLKCRNRRDKFLGGLRERRHDSIFEHASATFKLTTDRGITHELVRHRLASYTQSSTRYIKYTEGLPVVKPHFSLPGEEERWRRAMLAAEENYQALLAGGTPAEVARDLLPTCTAATIFVTTNFREWRHILKLRLPPGAHPKFRALARGILYALTPLCPAYFKDLYEEGCA